MLSFADFTSASGVSIGLYYRDDLCAHVVLILVHPSSSLSLPLRRRYTFVRIHIAVNKCLQLIICELQQCVVS